MKKIIFAAFCTVIILSIMRFGWLFSASERPYSEIRTDYFAQGNIDWKYGFIMSLNKFDFFTFFTNPDFITDVLLPVGNCAAGGVADSEICQALLVAIIRKTGEQALGYYQQYAQLMARISRPYQVIRVLQDMYSYDSKKIVKALRGLVTVNPALALIQFKEDALDFGLMQYVLLKYAAAVLRNPLDQVWLPLVQLVGQYWQKSADNVAKSKVIDFSDPSIIALAKADDFENARAKAVNPSVLLTTQGLADVLGIKI